MKAIVYYSYGSPERLRYEEIEKPEPGASQILIRVRAAAINPLDCSELKGVPFIFRMMFGLPGPSASQPSRPGVDVAGEVEKVGRLVTQFRPGDDVFGICVSDPRAAGAKVWIHHQGAFAEYVCTNEATLALKPDNVTFEQAASVPVAALTPLQGLRDKGLIQPGQKVLVNGAAGGVGTFAVQIAKSFGAVVTGVCSTRNVDMVRAIGADRVVDYTQENFTHQTQHYDLIFDCVGNHSLSACKRVLTTKGVYVMAGQLNGPGVIGLVMRLIAMPLLSRFGSQKLVMFLARPCKEEIEMIHDLMKAGR